VVTIALSVFGMAQPALAQDELDPVGAPPPPVEVIKKPPPPPPEGFLPVPTLDIERIPPATSYEFAAQVSYGSVAYFTDRVPNWVGFGFRGAWGKHFGKSRIGASGTATLEGDLTVHTLAVFEPAFVWDYVSEGGLLLGAGVGPAFAFTDYNATVVHEVGFEVAPSAAVRLGWSQTWTRVGRRLFVFAEPKVRMAQGRMTPVVAVAVGSGAGR